MLWARHGGRVARLQESRGWSGGSAEDRGPEDGCIGWLCREAQRTAVRTEGPRGRDWLAAGQLALSEWDSSD